MYVNCENQQFDPHRQYTYLRYTHNEIILIAVNFDNKACNVAINIPQHALDMIGIESDKYQAVEILSNTSDEKYLHKAIPFTTSIAAHGAVLWKIKLTQKTSSSMRKKWVKLFNKRKQILTLHSN